jgi:spoIIIJ-associated protein
MAGLTQNPDQNQNASVRSNGKSVEEAIQNALAILKLERNQVRVQIIDEGKRGILGLGAKDALVEVIPLQSVIAAVEKKASAPAEENTSTQAPETPQVEAEEEVPVTASSAGQAQPAVATTPQTDPEPISLPETTLALPVQEQPHIQAYAKQTLETLLDKMGVPANVAVRIGHDLVEEDETPPLTLDITGDDLGLLIGRRGETLRALQFVVRQILNKEASQWVPLIIDVEYYLVRRRKSLKQLAHTMADKVVFSKRKMSLEPMSSHERRIVHLALRDHEHVYTRSVGDADKRKVVILPK